MENNQNEQQNGLLKEQINETLLTVFDSLGEGIKPIIAKFLGDFLQKIDTTKIYFAYEKNGKYYYTTIDKNEVKIDIKTLEKASVIDITEYVNLSKELVNEL